MAAGSPLVIWDPVYRTSMGIGPAAGQDRATCLALAGPLWHPRSRSASRQPSGSCPRILPSLPAPRACLPGCLPPGLPYLCHRQPCLGGVWGDWVGGVSCHGGWGVAGRPGDTHFASGHPLFGVVQPPPFSEWGYVPRVFSAPASSRKFWGVPHVHLSLLR